LIGLLDQGPRTRYGRIFRFELRKKLATFTLPTRGKSHDQVASDGGNTYSLGPLFGGLGPNVRRGCNRGRADLLPETARSGVNSLENNEAHEAVDL